MRNIMKRVTSILLIVIMIVAYMPIMAFAAEDNIIASGTCGANAKYEFSDSGKMTIFGTGEIDESYFDWEMELNEVNEVIIKDGITSIDKFDFGYCSNLKYITIPGTVVSISNGAFEYCSKLTNVNIQDGVRSIGEYAFSGCDNLESITIPGSVASIGNNAFEYCSSLVNVNIQDGVQSIGEETFSNCENLKSITIPGSVKTIGPSAFWNCCYLTTVIISDGVQSIKDNAFSECESLESITIPGSVVSIGNFAFEYCSSLTNIIISDGVQSIGEYAFSECESIERTTIPGSVTSIGSSAFNECCSLKSVILLDGVKTIGEYAFYNCRYLQSITIPKSITYINKYAFLCDNLKYVFYAGSRNEWQTIKTINYNAELAEASIHYNATDHTYGTVTTKATLTRDGKVEKKCNQCDKVISSTKIYRPTKFTLSATTYTYDGKIKKPMVTVKDSTGKTLVKDTDYTLTYATGRKYVGKYSVKISFKGNYSETKTLYFKINPPKTSLSSVTATSRGFTAKWYKRTTQVTGYQIQYSTSSNFTSPKTVTITKNSITYKKVTKLIAKKRYYVRVRTYKTVGTTKYYSPWNGYKSVTTKA